MASFAPQLRLIFRAALRCLSSSEEIQYRTLLIFLVVLEQSLAGVQAYGLQGVIYRTLNTALHQLVQMALAKVPNKGRTTKAIKKLSLQDSPANFSGLKEAL